jgi:uncharacterized protein (TIGR03000 family)
VQSPAEIRVNVPADAQVFINDQPTTSTGNEREYVARGLRDGETYQYRLRVEFADDGKQVVEKKRLLVQAGDVVELDFRNNLPANKQSARPTQLTALH